jgi:hypothetical protein
MAELLQEPVAIAVETAVAIAVADAMIAVHQLAILAVAATADLANAFCDVCSTVVATNVVATTAVT